MGSDGVTVYQAGLEKCDCSAGFNPAAVDIAKNLLFDNRDSRKLTLVSPGEFKPWYDNRTLISMRFKFQPPNLSQISVPNSDPSLNQERLELLPESNPLLEFSPVYSGKSCLKHQQKECHHRSFDEGNDAWRLCDAQKLSDLPRRGSPRAKLPSTGHDNSEKKKLPVEELNPVAKSLWCASPPHVNCRKRKGKELSLEKLKETKLSQMKELHKLSYHQRGKWIVCARNSSVKGKGLTTEQLWKKVCSLIKEGHLPYCNAKFQRIQDEVWVYCDFGHSLKVRSTLEKALGNVGTFSFYVHLVGVVMEL